MLHSKSSAPSWGQYLVKKIIYLDWYRPDFQLCHQRYHAMDHSCIDFYFAEILSIGILNLMKVLTIKCNHIVIFPVTIWVLMNKYMVLLTLLELVLYSWKRQTLKVRSKIGLLTSSTKTYKTFITNDFVNCFWDLILIPTKIRIICIFSMQSHLYKYM